MYHRDFSCQLYEREASALNGLIVSDSENENAEEFVGLKDFNDIRIKALVSRCRTSVRRHAKNLKHKNIAEGHFLCRNKSKCISRILYECKDIGRVIEEFVQERNIGADAWRRTGVY